MNFSTTTVKVNNE